MNAIEPAYSHKLFGEEWPALRPALIATLAAALLTAAALALVLGAAPAYAGQAATGELAFYPCTQCHPVSVGADGKPTKQLPIGMEKHQIVLEVHDTLGKGSTGCLACHDDPTRNPGMLKLADGSLVDVQGDVSRVCQRCHFEKYREFTAGIHGRDQEKCTSAGCHDPHTPSWIYVPALKPFQGTGIQVRAVGATREPFKPFAGPPVDPPVYTPAWLTVASVIGALVSLGLIGFLVFGRRTR